MFDPGEWHLIEVRTGHVTLINAVSMPRKGARSTSFFLPTRHREQLQQQKLEDEAVPGCYLGQASTAYYNFPLPVRYLHCATGQQGSIRVLFWCTCIFSGGAHQDSLLCLFHAWYTRIARLTRGRACGTFHLLRQTWFITPVVFSQTALRRNCGRHRLRRGLGNIRQHCVGLVNVDKHSRYCSCRPCRPDISDHAWTEHIPQEKLIAERFPIAECTPNSDMSAICQQY